MALVTVNPNLMGSRLGGFGDEMFSNAPRNSQTDGRLVSPLDLPTGDPTDPLEAAFGLLPAPSQGESRLSPTTPFQGQPEINRFVGGGVVRMGTSEAQALIKAELKDAEASGRNPAFSIQGDRLHVGPGVSRNLEGAEGVITSETARLALPGTDIQQQEEQISRLVAETGEDRDVVEKAFQSSLAEVRGEVPAGEGERGITNIAADMVTQWEELSPSNVLRASQEANLTGEETAQALAEAKTNRGAFPTAAMNFIGNLETAKAEAPSKKLKAMGDVFEKQVDNLNALYGKSATLEAGRDPLSGELLGEEDKIKAINIINEQIERTERRLQDDFPKLAKRYLSETKGEKKQKTSKGKLTDKKVAQEFLEKAGGDRQKAEQLAIDEGYEL